MHLHRIAATLTAAIALAAPATAGADIVPRNERPMTAGERAGVELLLADAEVFWKQRGVRTADPRVLTVADLGYDGRIRVWAAAEPRRTGRLVIDRAKLEQFRDSRGDRLSRLYQRDFCAVIYHERGHFYQPEPGGPFPWTGEHAHAASGVMAAASIDSDAGIPWDCKRRYRLPRNSY